MDAGSHDVHGSSTVLGGVDQNSFHKSRSSVVWSVVESVIAEAATAIRKTEDLKALSGELGSNKAVSEEGVERLNDKEACEPRSSSSSGSEVSSHVELGTSKNSNKLADVDVSETVIVIDSGEASCGTGDDGRMGVKGEGDELGSSKVDESKMKVPEAVRDSHVINIKCRSGKSLGDNWEVESVCRIFHLSSEQSLDRKLESSSGSIAMDLVPLGCGCKDELRVAHAHCAEVRLKGNRVLVLLKRLRFTITESQVQLNSQTKMEGLEQWKKQAEQLSSQAQEYLQQVPPVQQIYVAIAMLLLTSFLFLSGRLFKRHKANTILLTGLSGSGKTVLFYQLRDGSSHLGTVTSMEPNEGTFVLHSEKSKNGKLKHVHLVDVPGHSRLRPKLDEFLPQAAGIVFVVDSLEFLPNCRAASEYLYDILTKASVVKKKIPVLILSNKTDKVTAHSKEFIRKQLEKELEKLRASRRAISTADIANDFTLGVLGEPFSFSQCQNKVKVDEAAGITGNITQVEQFIRDNI